MTQQMETHTRGEVQEQQRRVAELSAKQVTALRRLAEGRSFKEVAQIVGVSRGTLHRWRTQEPDFKAALQAWNADALDGARHRLVAIADEAVTAVCTAVSQGDAKLAMAVLKVLGITQRPAREQGECKEPLHATEEPAEIEETPAQSQEAPGEIHEEPRQIEESPAVAEAPHVRQSPAVGDVPALANGVDSTWDAGAASDANACSGRDDAVGAAPADDSADGTMRAPIAKAAEVCSMADDATRAARADEGADSTPGVCMAKVADIRGAADDAIGAARADEDADSTPGVCIAKVTDVRGAADDAAHAAPAHESHVTPASECNETASSESRRPSDGSALSSPTSCVSAGEIAVDPSGAESATRTPTTDAPVGDEPLLAASEAHHLLALNIAAASNAEATPVAVAATPSPYAELMRWRQTPFEQRSPAIERRIRELQTQVEAARAAEGISAASE